MVGVAEILSHLGDDYGGNTIDQCYGCFIEEYVEMLTHLLLSQLDFNFDRTHNYLILVIVKKCPTPKHSL